MRQVAHCVGAVVSPLLANVYLDRLDRAWQSRVTECSLRCFPLNVRFVGGTQAIAAGSHNGWLGCWWRW